ncbi:winged helix-turn-helix domain-containing protein [Kribbella sp. NPDC003505]|uniref:ArsR/SmtB family transcription factor n=1 Tax=Kribbella sp. NPDC003505 TaxID=3154448 RepID=UPI0033AD5A85
MADRLLQHDPALAAHPHLPGPRHTATVWDESARPTPVGLAAVIGKSRADLLNHLDTPRSTTELATRTGLTPGGVSQHLSTLRSAGLVTRHRTGRTVMYARTTAADSLIDAAS